MEIKDQAVEAMHVGERTRRGISWNLAGAVATNGMRVVVIAVLGRTLSSSDFGVVAAAISVNVILFSIRDIGIGQALIQRKELERGHLTSAFALSMYLGLAISGILVIGAPLIAGLYGIRESTQIVRVLGLLFALRGVSATSRMLCQRGMRFRAIAIIDSGAFCAGSVTSMVLAVLGSGPWSLVAGYLVEEAISTTLYLSVSRPIPSLRIDSARLRELMGFGIHQTAAQITGILATYGDNFVVGRVLGASSLGYYTRAYDLIKFPSTVFASIVGTVLFPAFSRLQDNRERVAIGFQRATFVNALLLLPLSAVLFVLAPEMIRILMGAGWDEAVWPFRVLTITILMRTTQKLGGLVASASGSVAQVARAYTVYMICVIGGAWIAIAWGITGVAVSTGIAILIVSIECTYLAIRVSGLSWRALLAAHIPGLVLASAVVGTAVPLTILARDARLQAAGVVVAATIPAVCVCVGIVALWMRSAQPNFRWLASELKRFVSRRRLGA